MVHFSSNFESNVGRGIVQQILQLKKEIWQIKTDEKLNHFDIIFKSFHQKDSRFGHTAGIQFSYNVIILYLIPSLDKYRYIYFYIISYHIILYCITLYYIISYYIILYYFISNVGDGNFKKLGFFGESLCWSISQDCWASNKNICFNSLFLMVH